MDRRTWALTSVIISRNAGLILLDRGRLAVVDNKATEQQKGSALAGQTRGGETDYSRYGYGNGIYGVKRFRAERLAAPGASGPEGDTVESAATGEDFSVTTPTQRYVSETQRHQNFLAAVASGDVRRMDFISTDFQPVDDPNSSYITFSLTLTGEARSTGVMVMKFESGMWRMAAVKELGGSLEGGTNYLVPATFEDALAGRNRGASAFLHQAGRGQGQLPHRRRGPASFRYRNGPRRQGGDTQRADGKHRDVPEEGLQPLAPHRIRLQVGQKMRAGRERVEEGDRSRTLPRAVRCSCWPGCRPAPPPRHSYAGRGHRAGPGPAPHRWAGAAERGEAVRNSLEYPRAEPPSFQSASVSGGAKGITVSIPFDTVNGYISHLGGKVRIALWRGAVQVYTTDVTALADGYFYFDFTPPSSPPYADIMNGDRVRVTDLGDSPLSPVDVNVNLTGVVTPSGDQVIGTTAAGNTVDVYINTPSYYYCDTPPGADHQQGHPQRHQLYRHLHEVSLCGWGTRPTSSPPIPAATASRRRRAAAATTAWWSTRRTTRSWVTPTYLRHHRQGWKRFAHHLLGRRRLLRRLVLQLRHPDGRDGLRRASAG